MASKFEKVSTRIFCISGVLSDIYCMPDMKILNFEELLNQRLHQLGYKCVVFYSGAKKRFFALDQSGIRGIEYLRKKPAQTEAQAASATGASPENRNASSSSGALPENRNAVASSGLSRRSIGGSRSVSAENNKQSKNYHIMADEIHDAEYANNYMLNTEEAKVLVFTSLDDFVTNSKQENKRNFFAYFEDWKSLPNENRNICIFLSKSVDSGNLQQMFGDHGNLSLQSLFIKGMNSSGAEFNQNSSLIVGSPLGDEIGNLIEYLRIVGYTYTVRNADNADEKVIAKLDFCHSQKQEIVRALSFFNREAEFSELKSMKESIEAYMFEQHTAVVPITPDIVSAIYSQSEGKYLKDEDPLEKLKNTQGWEPAYNVINSFVVSNRNRSSKQITEQTEESESGIERLEPNRAARASTDKVPNFVLQGPPGVGKTEIANLIGQILQKEGILKSGHTVVGSRDKLIGQYVGSTAIQTASMIEQAQEGVLLIDEVYNLAEGNEHTHGINYSAECINTLVAAMTNKNYRFCVIFSGYANRMDSVWNMNEGLFSRFGESNIINIEGYKPDLLRSIFEKQLSGYDQDSGQIYQLSKTVTDDLDIFFENFYNERDRENFGNARDMNLLAAAVKRAAGYRYIQNNIEGDITVEECDFGDKEKMFAKKGLSAEDIFFSIREYIGFDFLVDMFNDQLALKVESEEKGIEYPGPSHMIWYGNPGTGKSTAAQLTIDLYHSLGILGGTKPIYVDASEIMSVYMGGSAEQINKKMDEACQHNTLLIVEEAYQLIDTSNGKEAINAMLNRMETDRKNFNVIFVLYESRLDDFLKVNPGMESRVKTYKFNDYTGEQLTEIFMKMCEKNRDEISDEAKTAVSGLLQRLYEEGCTKNGNARIVRKLIENMRQLRYARVLDEMAVKMYGKSDPDSRGKISVLRSMKKIELPESIYRFEVPDIPADFGNEMRKALL